MVVPLKDANGPVVLVLGHPDIDTGRLVQCLCRQDALEFIRDDTDIKVVQWQVNNKYFTADLDVAIVHKASALSEELWARVDGVVFCYATDNAETHSRLVDEWHELIEEHGPEMLLCVGVCENQAPDEFEPAEDIQGWCVENNYEHVALGEWTHASPDAANGSIHDEKLGIDRIVEALNGHMWSNMVMKDGRSSAGPMDAALSSELRQASQSNGSPAAVSVTAQPDPLAGYLTADELALLNNGLFRPPGEGDDEDDDGGLEEAFSAMASIKERAAHMPDAQRRLVAERVATAFLAAMGGDPEDFSSDGADD